MENGVYCIRQMFHVFTQMISREQKDVCHFSSREQIIKLRTGAILKGSVFCLLVVLDRTRAIHTAKTTPLTRSTFCCIIEVQNTSVIFTLMDALPVSFRKEVKN